MTRVALVTGAARGIGAATVRRLLADGWAVVAVDRAADDPRLPYPLATEAELAALAPDDAGGVADPSRLAAPAGPIGLATPAGPRVVTVRADASDPAALAGAVALAEERFGGVDAVVAVAGAIAGGVPLWEMPPEQERAVLEVNLGGVLAAARAGVPALLRRPEPRDGRFIAVASTAATRGLPRLAAYCAAKAGIAGLVRALALELAGTGVTANTVSPGSTRGAMLDESARLYGMTAEAFAAQQPIHRLLEPGEIAELIAWLAGAGGRGATGADYPLDGGLAL